MQQPAQRGASREMLLLWMSSLACPSPLLETPVLILVKPSTACGTYVLVGHSSPKGHRVLLHLPLRRAYLPFASDGTWHRSRPGAALPSQVPSHLQAVLQLPFFPSFLLAGRKMEIHLGIEKGCKKNYGRFLVCEKQTVWCNK